MYNLGDPHIAGKARTACTQEHMPFLAIIFRKTALLIKAQEQGWESIEAQSDCKVAK